MSQLRSLVEGRVALQCVVEDRIVLGRVLSACGSSLVVEGEDPTGPPPIGPAKAIVFRPNVAAVLTSEVRLVEGGMYEIYCREPIDLIPTTLSLTVVSEPVTAHWASPFDREPILIEAVGPDGFAFSSEIHLPMDDLQTFHFDSLKPPIVLSGEIEFQRISEQTRGGVRIGPVDRVTGNRWRQFVDRLTKWP